MESLISKNRILDIKNLSNFLISKKKLYKKMEFVIKKSSCYFISKTQIDVFLYQELKKNRINSKTAR